MTNPSNNRELIVIAKRDIGLQLTREGIVSDTGPEGTALTKLLTSEGGTLKPIFNISDKQPASLDVETGIDVPDLSIYYRVDAPDERLDELALKMHQLNGIEAAYVKPPTEPAGPAASAAVLDEPPNHTTDFTGRQGYLEPAPGGIDARYAWSLNARGAGVRIIDIEGAWRFSHEDHQQNQGGVVGGTESTDINWRNHGSAVTGEFGGDGNAFGITGISPDANVEAISIFGGLGSAAAIQRAADRLSPGDIILIELHRPGPRFNFQNRNDQRGYIAIEWWEDDFAAIRYAVSRGVIVVEAAGNGAENLDDTLYNTRPMGFPESWKNPFARRDSGAVMVGAGAPPPGTHGRDHGPDRSRLDFSNWGSMIDAQGWGREVTTTGYGDLQGGTDEDEWYTDQFSGTSSASPIVVGALACVQSHLRSGGRIPLSPSRARELLRLTGSPQQDAPGRPATQRIGKRPDLKQMLDRAVTSHFKLFHGGNGTTLVDSPTPLQGIFYGVAWNGMLTWHRYTGRGVQLGNPVTGQIWHPNSGNVIGRGFDHMLHVFGCGDGVIMAVHPNGNLYWYSYSGNGENDVTGTRGWHPNSGNVIGNGWQNFSKIFVSPMAGRSASARLQIFAVAKNGDLHWYSYNGNGEHDPSGSRGWHRNSGNRVGNGWQNFRHIHGSGNVFFAVQENGNLLWYSYSGQGEDDVSGVRGWHPNSGNPIGRGWQDMRHLFGGVTELGGPEPFRFGHVIYAVDKHNINLRWYFYAGQGESDVTGARGWHPNSSNIILELR